MRDLARGPVGDDAPSLVQHDHAIRHRHDVRGVARDDPRPGAAGEILDGPPMIAALLPTTASALGNIK
ncbi:MAG: hypothetical protein ACO4CI_12895, partial [Phycisphaerales bacterium]